jgi:hypothetical protein
MHTPDSASAMEHEHTIDRAHSGSDVQGITQFVTKKLPLIYALIMTSQLGATLFLEM